MIFGYYVVPIPISPTTGPGNLNNLKEGRYFILQPGSVLLFFNLFHGE